MAMMQRIEPSSKTHDAGLCKYWPGSTGSTESVVCSTVEWQSHHMPICDRVNPTCSFDYPSLLPTTSVYYNQQEYPSKHLSSDHWDALVIRKALRPVFVGLAPPTTFTPEISKRTG